MQDESVIINMLQWTPFSISFFFIFFMVIEITLLFSLGEEVGGAMVVVEIIASAFLGVYFIKNNALKRLSLGEDQETRKPLLPLIQEVIAFLIAGLLLILPGLITDIIGLLLAIPHLRWRFMDYFEQKGGMAYTRQSSTFGRVFNMDDLHEQDWRNDPSKEKGSTTIIEGEYYEVDFKKGDKNE